MTTIVEIVPYQLITLGHLGGTRTAPSSWTPPAEKAYDALGHTLVSIQYFVETLSPPAGSLSFTIDLQHSNDKQYFPPLDTQTVNVTGGGVFTQDILASASDFARFLRVTLTSVDFQGTIAFKAVMTLKKNN